MSKKYNIIGMGGTFDHLHAGHQELLRFAAAVSEEIWVGVATEMFTKSKHFSFSIEDFETRKIHVTQFLEQEGIKYRIFPLNDPCGPTLQGSPVEAIVVTDVTRPGGEFINQCRVKLQLPELPIEVCEMLKDEEGHHLSSTRIRSGKVSRTGQVYALQLEKGIFLDTTQKRFFGEKHGEIVLSPTMNFPYVFITGDMVLETFLLNNWPYHLGIFDGFNQRSTYQSPHVMLLKEYEDVTNPAGQITKELVKVVEMVQDQVIEALENNGTLPMHVKVHGEEDLAAVLLGLIAPLGAAIYYGQPNEGIIEMLVTEELKEKFYQAISSHMPRHVDPLSPISNSLT